MLIKTKQETTMGFNNNLMSSIMTGNSLNGVQNPGLIRSVGMSAMNGMTPNSFNQSQPNNMATRQPTPINPKVFSNMGTMSNLYGQANPGTFTRSVTSPLAQMNDLSQPINDPSLVPVVDPTNPNMQAGAENVMAATGIPQQPPYNVQQATTPPYDLSNS